MEITQEELKKHFRYDSSTGFLIWEKPTSNSVKKGTIAGKVKPSGYIAIDIHKKTYYAHRLIWLYIKGFLPTRNTEIDHINRNKSDNRLSNLRLTSHQCNIRNSGRQTNNTSGVTGVSLDKKNKKWYSYIKLNGVTTNLGGSTDFIEAVALRLSAEQCLDWSGCNSTSDSFIFMKNYLKKGFDND